MNYKNTEYYSDNKNNLKIMEEQEDNQKTIKLKKPFEKFKNNNSSILKGGK